MVLKSALKEIADAIRLRPAAILSCANMEITETRMPTTPIKRTVPKIKPANLPILTFSAMNFTLRCSA
jgi:hypothetical protein